MAPRINKLLEFCWDHAPQAAELFPEADHVDILEISQKRSAPNMTYHDIRQSLPAHMKGQYDVVFAAHVLEKVHFTQVPKVVDHIKQALRLHGEVWFVTYSLDWVGDMLRNDEQPATLQRVIYGFTEDPANQPFAKHESGYTLYLLRGLVERMGLITRKAYILPQDIEMDGQKFTIAKNYVIAVRVEE